MRSIVLGSLVVIGLVAYAHGPARAQTPPIKPGLWEVKGQREVDGQRVQMPDTSGQLPNMPPEARAQMEASLRRRGLDLSGGNPKVCLTKESLDAGQWQRQPSSCTVDYTTRSGDTWKWHSSCTEPPSETDGEAHFVSADAYTVKTATTMTIQGRTRVSKTTLDSKWLGPDCGEVVPMKPRPQAAPGVSR